MSLFFIFAPAVFISGIGELIVERITRSKSYRRGSHKFN